MNVTVIDYGVGNLLSVKRALEYCEADVKFAQSPPEIERAERLILPGVGAFADGIRGLAERGLIDAIKKYVDTGRPLLGICLGMQMMMDFSEEHGLTEGLGLCRGKVKKIPELDTNGSIHKVPNIGWYRLESPRRETWTGTILRNVMPGEALYFVHSYMAAPDDNHNRLADYKYGGQNITAVIAKNNVYGCQFHPEKSGAVGLKILKDFLTL